MRGPMSRYLAGSRSCHTSAGSTTWSSTEMINGRSPTRASIAIDLTACQFVRRPDRYPDRDVPARGGVAPRPRRPAGDRRQPRRTARPPRHRHDRAARRRPRILGGRDEEAGGTWLAVNEHGVVAGLTNRPSPEGRDPAKRSRGELPLALARHRDAASAVDEFVTTFRPANYNPAWLLVGDRTTLYALDMTGSAPGDGRPRRGARPRRPHPGEQPAPRRLAQGGPRAGVARRRRDPRGREPGGAGAFGARRPQRSRSGARSPPGTGTPTSLGDHEGPRSGPSRPWRRACTPRPTARGRRPWCVFPPRPETSLRCLVADGHPCTSPFVDVTDLFEAA